MSDWRNTLVKDLGEIITGRTPSTARRDFYGGNCNLISPADLDNGKYIRTAHKRLTKLGLKECRPLPKGTVLVGCIGNVGKLGMVGNNESATNQQINALICNAEHDPEFVYYCFQENRDRLEKRAVKTTVPILNKTNFGNFELNVPPLPEQKKIAEILSTLQRAIEEQERIIQTTTELKKALMQKLFTEGLRGEPQKQTEIGPIPESWEVVEIGDVFKFTSGKTKPKDTAAEPSDERTIPVYGGNGVLGYSADNLLSEEVLILGRVGEYCGCAHLTAPVSWVTDNALYAKEEKRSVNRTYIRNHFEHLNLNQYSNKMGQPLITQGIINRVKFGLPSREEQDELAYAFETLDTRVAQIQAKRDLLQDLFRTLLHELMTAKTRVHDLEIAA